MQGAVVHPTAATPPASAGVARTRSVGIVSTFPPTSCGIATFSAALAAGLTAAGVSVDVVRTDASPFDEDVLVTASLTDGSADGHPFAVLNATDVVIVQHEFGLYGGLDGGAVLDLAAGIEVPIVVVAHTVLSRPTSNQRSVLERLCAIASTVVVMTETARDRLVDGYDVDARRVVLIPHGAATPPAAHTSSHPSAALRPRILTWGLLGPGKGIEWAIEALDALSDLEPLPEYVVAGATHPKVRERQGEAYREMLTALGGDSRSGVPVVFDDTYRDLESLTELIASADVVVLPYDSVDQVTSGVLVDAVAAGRPVVSTAFPHAVELLRSGAGLVVPRRDPAALGAALRAVLDDPEIAAAMAAEARRLAPDLAWAAVARRYLDTVDELIGASPAVST
jgi:glycosyltransferase involved in cell wall biosynthesis